MATTSYATAAELRARVGITKLTDDGILLDLLTTATKQIDDMCGRPEGFVADALATVRYYTGRGRPYLFIDDCVVISAVAVKDSSSDTSYTAWGSPTTNMAGDGDWFAFAGSQVRPNYNPRAQNKPYLGIMVDPNGDYASFTGGRYSSRTGFRPIVTAYRGVPTVRVTATWGYNNTVPTPIKTACIMQAARWYNREHGAMGDALANPDVGEVRYVKTLDPDIKLLLVDGRYVKRTVG